MRGWLFVGVLLFGMTGCAFQRSDFVSGPDGQPKTGDVSDTGKAVGDVVRNRGPSYSLSY